MTEREREALAEASAELNKDCGPNVLLRSWRKVVEQPFGFTDEFMEKMWNLATHKGFYAHDWKLKTDKDGKVRWCIYLGNRM